MSRAKKNQLIEFKGNTLSAIVVTLRSLQPDELAQAAEELFGEDPFFDGDAALLDLGQCDDSAGFDKLDWAALVGVFKPRGLHVIGVRGANDALRKSAMTAGLPDFTAVERTVRSQAQTELAAQPPSEVTAAIASTPVPSTPISEPSAPALPVAVATLIVDHPLRSGQQVYARGGDLVVLAAVSSGAEVIADGSIHIYAPLRGRALAGARGALNARIFTTRFEAELVSIAGVYRTFEEGFPDSLAGQPVQIQLSRTAGDDTSKLAIVSLKTN